MKDDIVPTKNRKANEILDDFRAWFRSQKSKRSLNSERWKITDSTQYFILEEKFNSGVIGKAFVNTIGGEWAVGVIADHSIYPQDVASTASHELGHNFGLGHDGPQECFQNKFLTRDFLSVSSSFQVKRY